MSYEQGRLLTIVTTDEMHSYRLRTSDSFKAERASGITILNVVLRDKNQMRYFGYLSYETRRHYLDGDRGIELLNYHDEPEKDLTGWEELAPIALPGLMKIDPCTIISSNGQISGLTSPE